MWNGLKKYIFIEYTKENKYTTNSGSNTMFVKQTRSKVTVTVKANPYSPRSA